jgi:hypothetical protein
VHGRGYFRVADRVTPLDARKEFFDFSLERVLELINGHWVSLGALRGQRWHGVNFEVGAC